MRFRFRSADVTGRWRATRRDALRDAVRAGLAKWTDESWEDVRWIFGGSVEEDSGDPSDE